MGSWVLKVRGSEDSCGMASIQLGSIDNRVQKSSTAGNGENVKYSKE